MKTRIYAWLAAATLLLAFDLAAAAETDKPGCADHPLFPTRMSGFYIVNCEMKDFDVINFETGKRQKNSVEGRSTRLTYRITDRSKDPSALAVVRNYENAIKSVGGKIAFTNLNLRTVNGMVAKNGQEVWAQAMKGNGQIWLSIVEKAGMAQEILANADAFGNDIKATGHAAVYGIYFDSGKSDVKPESEAALQEVAKLLASDPTLKLLVVGHTDSVGQIEANMKLAQARSEAVVQALTRNQGVDAARLKAKGAGPIAPVASNRTEEGRSKNRRVELVEQ